MGSSQAGRSSDCAGSSNTSSPLKPRRNSRGRDCGTNRRASILTTSMEYPRPFIARIADLMSWPARLDTKPVTFSRATAAGRSPPMVARLFTKCQKAALEPLWSPARPPASERSVHGNDAQARSTRSGICDCVRVPRSPKWNWCASPWSPKCARNIASFFGEMSLDQVTRSPAASSPIFASPIPAKYSATRSSGSVRSATTLLKPTQHPARWDGSAEETRLGAPSAAGRPTQAGPTNSAVRWLHRGRGGLPRARRLSAVRDSRRSCSRR